MSWSETTEVVTTRIYTLRGDDADDIAALIRRAKADPERGGARVKIEGGGMDVRVSFKRVVQTSTDHLGARP